MYLSLLFPDFPGVAAAAEFEAENVDDGDDDDDDDGDDDDGEEDKDVGTASMRPVCSNIAACSTFSSCSVPQTIISSRATLAMSASARGVSVTCNPTETKPGWFNVVEITIFFLVPLFERVKNCT